MTLRTLLLLLWEETEEFVDEERGPIMVEMTVLPLIMIALVEIVEADGEVEVVDVESPEFEEVPPLDVEGGTVREMLSIQIW